MYLLTADWHLDDSPNNDYRWRVFDHVRAALAGHPISLVFVLGDTFDRKDRHSAALVNRFLAEIEGGPFVFLRGNHDTTLRPPNYFDWLVDYISQPAPNYCSGLLLLPFTANPVEDWAAIDLGGFRAIFMHATVTGAQVQNRIVLENPSFPKLPQHVKVYSGDVHYPQQVGNVTYVGTPHPVIFGEDHHFRMLLVDEESYDIVGDIDLTPPRKLVFDIDLRDGVADLGGLGVRPGDQVKLRLLGAPSLVDDMRQVEQDIARWATAVGITVAGTEMVIEAGYGRGVDIQQTPEAILRQFAERENLTDAMLAVGLELLQEAAGSSKAG